MAKRFPSVQHYALLCYIFGASAASAYICHTYHDLINSAAENDRLWFYALIFLTNNVFAVLATIIYWLIVERQENMVLIENYKISLVEDYPAKNPGMISYNNMNYEPSEDEDC